MLQDLGRTLASIASPRSLLAVAIVLGSLTGISGRGTLAFFTSQAVSAPSTFVGGTVDIAGLLSGSGSTASQLTTSIFSWDASGARGGGAAGLADCQNINTDTSASLLDVTSQRMTPGHYCVAKIDLYNTNTQSIDAWIRMRIVRATAVNATTDSQLNAANEALNDRLRFYLHEYTGATEGVTGNQAFRNANCTTASFKPTWSGPTDNTATAGVAYDYNSVPGTSYGLIPSMTSQTGAGYSNASRAPLTSLGEIGKNLGAHPGISAVTINDSDNTAPYKAGQATDVLGLVNATVETSAVSQASANGLRLRKGTSADGTGAAAVADQAPTEGNMSTALAARNSYNLIGNDEISNPVRQSAQTTNNGTEAHGTVAEATLAAGGKRFFCAAIFFPIDTDHSLSTVYSGTDSVGSAAGLGRTYATSYTAGQYANCAADVIAAPPTGTATAGCASLGRADAGLTAANGKGDNAAAGGNVKYYLTVSASQKAGRTVN